MLVKKMERVKKLAKMVKVLRGRQQSKRYECLTGSIDKGSPSSMTPTGFFAVYVGEDHQRFLVPMDFLSHPLFKMLLEKAYDEYGFDQRNGLVVPCTVSLFQEVLKAVECSNGQFDIEKLMDEFI